MSDCQLGVYCGNRARHLVAAVCGINCGVREFHACPAHAQRAALPRCICGLQLRVLSVTGVPASPVSGRLDVRCPRCQAAACLPCTNVRTGKPLLYGYHQKRIELAEAQLWHSTPHYRGDGRRRTTAEKTGIQLPPLPPPKRRST